MTGEEIVAKLYSYIEPECIFHDKPFNTVNKIDIWSKLWFVWWAHPAQRIDVEDVTVEKSDVLEAIEKEILRLQFEYVVEVLDLEEET